MFDNIGTGTGNYARMQGCKRSVRKPPRFSSYRPIHFGTDDLPDSVDLREDLSPIEDQSAVSSCTANAIAGAYEYLAMREFDQSGDVSRLFIYYNARKFGTTKTKIAVRRLRRRSRHSKSLEPVLKRPGRTIPTWY